LGRVGIISSGGIVPEEVLVDLQILVIDLVENTAQ
jgi:hypothetical protein